jgi:hypothetical protein
MTEQEKKKPGRPKTDLGPTVPLQVRLTPEQHAWITSQDEGASEIVRRWIDESISKEQK